MNIKDILIVFFFRCINYLGLRNIFISAFVFCPRLPSYVLRDEI